MSFSKQVGLLAVVCMYIVFPVSLMAQTVGSVKGKLSDTKKQSVAYATVTLLRADSTVGGGDLSKDDGSFNIASVAPGKYSLRIEAMGYATKWVSVTTTADKPESNLGTIKVEQTATNLNAVEVTGEKAAVEMKIDKKVFNVEKNTTTVGGSAADVLQNVPAVSVDGDGNVSLRGKGGVTILIDGKPATLLGPDLTNTLASMPAASISNVEVITNPSAKYDAQGTSGIINIITKKDNKLGMNGSVTAGAGTRDKYNGSLNFNVRKGKWSTFLNSSFRSNRTFNNITTDRQDIQDGVNGKFYHTYEHAPRQHGGFFNTIGATYDFNNNNSLTFTGNVNRMQFGYTDAALYQTFDGPAKKNLLSTRDVNSDFLVSPMSYSGSLDYKHKFKKKGEELSVDATYSIFEATRRQNIKTVITPDIAISNPIIEKAPGHGGNNSLNVWADYTNPLFTKNGKLGAGFKSQFYNFTSGSDNPTITYGQSAPVPDSQFLVSYNYTQQIHAAYVNWNDQLGKFSYQLGLRAEDAIYNGTGTLPSPATFHNSFFNFFPSAFVAYQLTNQQSVYVNYSRRVNRPNFFQMMPFKDFSNPGVITVGNPDILPEFIHNIELSYNKSDDKGNNFILSGYFARTDNLIERIPRKITAADSTLGLGDDTTSMLSQPVNIAAGTTFGLEGTARIQIMPMWDATLSANAFQNMLTIGDVSPQYSSFLTDNSGFAWFAKANTNIKLSKTLSIQLNGNYESPKVIAQGSIRESYWVDVAVKKNLWNNKATLTLNCSDVFKTRQFITNYYTNDYNQYINRVKETRIGNISFTYRFGKTDFGKNIAGKGGRPEKSMDKKPVKPNGDEDRQNNLKQSDDDNGGGGGQGGGRKG